MAKGSWKVEYLDRRHLVLSVKCQHVSLTAYICYGETRSYILSYICYGEVWLDSLICYREVWSAVLYLLWISLVRHTTFFLEKSGQTSYLTFVMEKSGQTAYICCEVWSDSLHLLWRSPVIHLIIFVMEKFG